MLDMNIFNNYLMMLSDMYAPKPLSENAIMGYYAVLQHMSNEEFISSCKKIMSEWSYSYMPKPAHILNALKDKQNFEIEANNEWKKVVEAIERKGRYQNIVFDNIVTNTAVHTITGGKWSDLCNKNYDQLDWIKKDFVKFYIHFRSNPEKNKTNMLLGLTDDTKAIEIKSTVNSPNVLRSEKLAIDSKLDSKKEVLQLDKQSNNNKKVNGAEFINQKVLSTFKSF